MSGSKKISQLTELTILSDDDTIEFVDASEVSLDTKNKKVSLLTLKAFINATTQSSDLFEDWDSGTTYSTSAEDQYVFYNNIIYLFIKLTDSTNERPDLNPLVWDQKTSADFAHIQNTDQYLDLGGPYEISSAKVTRNVKLTNYTNFQ